MSNYKTDWIFDVGLKLAVAMCLGTLAMALSTGAGPITALFRSGAAFAVFTILGWVAAFICRVPSPVDTEEEPSEESKKDAPAEKFKKETSENESQFEPQTMTRGSAQPDRL